MEQIDKINSNGVQLDEVVNGLLGDRLNALDQYIANVRQCFLSGQEILDQDLEKIVLQIPVYIYDVIVFAQQMEMRKGVAAEQATLAENEQLLQATGTVQEKKAKAENATIQDRFIEMAYKTASSIVSRKVDGAIDILNSARKIQASRQKEKYLTEAAGGGVGAF